MKMRDSIAIFAPSSATPNSKGMLVVPYVLNRTIKGDFQAVQTRYNREEAGTTNLASHIIFCKDFGIDELSRFQINGLPQVYKVTSVVPYINHNEVYVEKVI